MKALVLAVVCLFCPACAEFTLRVPLGDGGKYGYIENKTRYIPPDDLYQRVVTAWNPPLFRDK